MELETGKASWDEVLDRFRRYVGDDDVSIRSVARELELSHTALQKILSGETSQPHRRTRSAIRGWVQNKEIADALYDRQKANNPHSSVATKHRNARSEIPEEQLLEYFLEHFELMGTFMTTATEGLDARDRRKVAMAILNGFKRLAIEAGERIPPELFELERRFLQE